jgi:ribonuclease P protein component
MLARAHRFHGYSSLRGVYQRGQTVRGSLVSLRFDRRDPRKPYRVAVVVSRKVNKSAVKRNRIRRRIYEAVRTAAVTPRPGADLIFTVFSDQVAEMDVDKLRATVNDLLKQTKQ